MILNTLISTLLNTLVLKRFDAGDSMSRVTLGALEKTPRVA
jgi:hypothetical protein